MKDPILGWRVGFVEALQLVLITLRLHGSLNWRWWWWLAPFEIWYGGKALIYTCAGIVGTVLGVVGLRKKKRQLQHDALVGSTAPVYPRGIH